MPDAMPNNPTAINDQIFYLATRLNVSERMLMFASFKYSRQCAVNTDWEIGRFVKHIIATRQQSKAYWYLYQVVKLIIQDGHKKLQRERILNAIIGEYAQTHNIKWHVE